jgi:hypothetical protein
MDTSGMIAREEYTERQAGKIAPPGLPLRMSGLTQDIWGYIEWLVGVQATPPSAGVPIASLAVCTFR